MPPSPFVVKNGSKMRGRSSGEMPTPVSQTSTTALPFSSVRVDDADLVRVRVPLGDGLRRVHEQVEEHLAEARLVRVDRRHVGEALHEARAVPDLVPRHLHRALGDAADVGHASLLDVALRERQEVAHDLAHAVRPLDRLLERPHERRRCLRRWRRSRASSATGSSLALAARSLRSTCSRFTSR